MANRNKIRLAIFLFVGYQTNSLLLNLIHFYHINPLKINREAVFIAFLSELFYAFQRSFPRFKPANQ